MKIKQICVVIGFFLLLSMPSVFAATLTSDDFISLTFDLSMEFKKQVVNSLNSCVLLGNNVIF